MLIMLNAESIEIIKLTLKNPDNKGCVGGT